MRICLIVRALPHHRLGGLEYHTLDLAKALGARGHDVTLVTSRRPERDSDDAAPAGLDVRYLRRGRPGDYSAAFFREVEREVARLDGERPFDVIHSQDFAGLFLKLRPGRTVTTVHGTMFSETPLDRRYWRCLGLRDKLRALRRFKVRLFLQPFFRRALRRADVLIVDSEYTQRELLLAEPALRPKIDVIPLGIDPLRYPEAARPPAAAPGSGRPLRIVLLGRVQRMKGLEQALLAAQLVSRRGVEFRMDIGGAGDYQEELSSRIESLGLAGTVIAHGRIPPAETARFFSGADLFLFPDLTQPAFGLVAVEALLYGIPVVAARSGAIPEVVTEEVGWLYEPWDVAELAGLLERLARRPEQISDKAARARKYAARFTADSMAAAVEAVYARMIGL